MLMINDQLFQILKDKATVITRSAFWKIPRDNHDDEIHLKIGRYKKPQNWNDRECPEVLDPKSELTLDNEELRNLIAFLQTNYEPFKSGVKAFLPLDNPFEKSNADQIKKILHHPDKAKILGFLIENEIISNELEIGLGQARKAKAIKQFEDLLTQDARENIWQNWFKENPWVLGSEFVKILDERSVDTENITDFLMQSYDGFLDVIEIKRPNGELKFWSQMQDHGNWIPHQDLVKAITQALKYIYEIEREANSVKFIERTNVKVIKPRCVLIFGRSNDWNKDQAEAFRILNSGYHCLNILTYDHVLSRAKRILGINDEYQSIYQ